MELNAGDADKNANTEGGVNINIENPTEEDEEDETREADFTFADAKKNMKEFEKANEGKVTIIPWNIWGRKRPIVLAREVYLLINQNNPPDSIEAKPDYKKLLRDLLASVITMAIDKGEAKDKNDLWDKIRKGNIGPTPATTTKQKRGRALTTTTGRATDKRSRSNTILDSDIPGAITTNIRRELSDGTWLHIKVSKRDMDRTRMSWESRIPKGPPSETQSKARENMEDKAITVRRVRNAVIRACGVQATDFESFSQEKSDVFIARAKNQDILRACVDMEASLPEAQHPLYITLYNAIGERMYISGAANGIVYPRQNGNSIDFGVCRLVETMLEAPEIVDRKVWIGLAAPDQCWEGAIVFIFNEAPDLPKPYFFFNDLPSAVCKKGEQASVPLRVGAINATWRCQACSEKDHQTKACPSIRPLEIDFEHPRIIRDRPAL